MNREKVEVALLTQSFFFDASLLFCLSGYICPLQLNVVRAICKIDLIAVVYHNCEIMESITYKVFDIYASLCYTKVVKCF